MDSKQAALARQKKPATVIDKIFGSATSLMIVGLVIVVPGLILIAAFRNLFVLLFFISGMLFFTIGFFIKFVEVFARGLKERG